MNIGNLVRVINNKRILLSYNVFNDLKRYTHNLKLNKIRAEQIYHKLYNSCETFLKYYTRNSELRKYKLFYKWKNSGILSYNIEKLRAEIEASVEEKLSNEIVSLENQITEKLNENNNLKSNITKYTQNEADLMKKIKSYEDKENDYLANISKLEVMCDINIRRRRECWKRVYYLCQTAVPIIQIHKNYLKIK
jgi:hypothetical protein